MLHDVRRVITAAVLVVLVSATTVTAQMASDVWREFAQRVDVGTELNVRMNDGRRIRATIIGAREDAVLLLPRTRVPVPVQAVPYTAIVLMEPRNSGHNAGKAVALGLASGVGVFFGIMAIFVAAVGD